MFLTQTVITLMLLRKENGVKVLQLTKFVHVHCVHNSVCPCLLFFRTHERYIRYVNVMKNIYICFQAMEFKNAVENAKELLNKGPVPPVNVLEQLQLSDITNDEFNTTGDSEQQSTLNTSQSATDTSNLSTTGDDDDDNDKINISNIWKCDKCLFTNSYLDNKCRSCDMKKVDNKTPLSQLNMFKRAEGNSFYYYYYCCLYVR